MKPTSIIISIVLTLTLMAGCCPHPPPLPPNVMTDPMVKVVADINENNSKVPTLWSHHYYEADIVDDKGQNHHFSGDGVLLYQAPGSMRLTAGSVVGNVFEIGSNPNTFWLKASPDTGDAMWWGKYKNFTQAGAEASDIPIRPDMVLDVLGIATINTNFNQLPAPTMRFNREGDAYVFVWIAKLPDRWVALREVWYDRVTKRPRLVLLYDLNGRVVLKGVLDLNKYRQVEVEGLPRQQWPWVPGEYDLSFPDKGSRLRFTLDQSELQHRSGPVWVPNVKSFRMPDPENAGVDRVVEIGAPAADVQ